MKQPPVLETRIVPPEGLIKKLSFYTERYGFWHALLSGLGRKSQSFWNLIGPLATSRFIQQTLKSNEEITLNLGGGGNCNRKYITADIDARADIYTNITKRLPFPDKSVANVYLEEVIEHISLYQGQQLLSECFRILKPEGVIRIITPDLEYFAKSVIDDGTVDEINEVFNSHGHKYIYSKEKLRDVVRNAKFTDTVFTNYLDTKSQLGHLDSHPFRFNHSPDISMYLESEKPRKLPDGK